MLVYVRQLRDSLLRDTLEIFEYFRETINMWLHEYKCRSKDIYWWAKLAEVIGLRGAVIFSVDGLRDTNL